MTDEKKTPKIYVFCNNKGCKDTGSGSFRGWHNMQALAEDGTGLAGHLCSNHAFARHDMGIDANGWNRDLYAKHYPDGFEVVWVADPEKHEGLQAALARPDPNAKETANA